MTSLMSGQPQDHETFCFGETRCQKLKCDSLEMRVFEIDSCRSDTTYYNVTYLLGKLTNVDVHFWPLMLIENQQNLLFVFD